MFLISCGEEAPDTGIENQGRVEEEIETTGTDEESALDAERDPSSAPKGMKEAKEEGP